MDPTTVELMFEHVRAIYRAVAGSELPEPTTAEPPPTPEEVRHSFEALEALARTVSAVTEHVPPFHAPRTASTGEERGRPRRTRAQPAARSKRPQRRAKR
jgi:hypothetical protein